MKLRLHTPSLPTALSFLALSIALGGTALAATGQLVNIGDPNQAAQVATVDTTGALKTNGATALPRGPFSAGASVLNNAEDTSVVGPTTAALAITGIRIANFYGNTLPSQVVLSQYALDGGTCSLFHH